MQASPATESCALSSSWDAHHAVNMGLNDHFRYKYQEAPSLETRWTWCFKLVLDPNGRAIIETKRTSDLRNVVALSYTYGESLQLDGDGKAVRNRELGTYMESKRICRVILGKEWDLAYIRSTLAGISNDKWLWMDQVAKDLAGDEMDVVATFAPVYARCDGVVVLLPGDYCVAAVEGVGPGLLQNDVNTVYRALTTHVCRCPIWAGKHRWFMRLWTRQETLYAKTLVCVHVGEAASCRHAARNTDNLEIRARSAIGGLYEALLAKMSLRSENADLLQQDSRVKRAAALFLLGARLERCNGSPSFVENAWSLAGISRVATRDVDMILAVWAGLPSYDVPRSKALLMSFDDVMRDAWAQYGRRTMFLLPQGLTEGMVGMAHSRPSFRPSRLGLCEGFRPSLRSLYGPFQYRGAGILGVTSNAIAPEIRPLLRMTEKILEVRRVSFPDDAYRAAALLRRCTYHPRPWVREMWRESLESAMEDPEREQLKGYKAECELLALVMEGTPLQLAMNRYSGRLGQPRAVRGGVLAGTLVMCVTGSWGRDPAALSESLAVTELDGCSTLCVGRTGVFRLGYGATGHDLFYIEEGLPHPRIAGMLPPPVNPTCSVIEPVVVV